MVSTAAIYLSELFVTFNLLLAFYFIYKLYKSYVKHKLIVPLAFAISNIVGIIASLSKLYFLNNNPILLFQGSSGIDLIFGITSAFVIIVSFDLYESSHLSATKLSIAAVLASYSLISPILGFTMSEEYHSVRLILGLGAAFFFLFIIITTLRALKRMGTYLNPQQKNLLKYLKYYTLITFGGITTIYTISGVSGLGQLKNPNFIQSAINIAIPEILIFLGNIFFFLGYIRADHPAALQPQKIDQFIIISSEGVPIFTHTFEESEEIEDVLLSGALTAIKSVLLEATNIAGDLEEIKLGEKFILLDTVEEATGVLFTDRPTSYLYQMLENSMNEVKNVVRGVKVHDIGEEVNANLKSIVLSNMTYIPS